MMMWRYRAVCNPQEAKLKVYEVEGEEARLKWERAIEWRTHSPSEVAEWVERAVNGVVGQKEIEQTEGKRLTLSLEKVEKALAIYESYFMGLGYVRVELPLDMFEGWIPRIIAISVKFNPDREEVQQIIREHNKEVGYDED